MTTLSLTLDRAPGRDPLEHPVPQRSGLSHNTVRDCTPHGDLQVVVGPLLHRQGRGGAIPESTGSGVGPVRGREVPDRRWIAPVRYCRARDKLTATAPLRRRLSQWSKSTIYGPELRTALRFAKRPRSALLEPGVVGLLTGSCAAACSAGDCQPLHVSALANVAHFCQRTLNTGH